MHYGTYAEKQTGSTWDTEFGCNLEVKQVMQLTWVSSKYSVETGLIVHVEGPTIVNLRFRNVLNLRSSTINFDHFQKGTTEDML